MLRYTLFITVILASAATAMASINAGKLPVANAKNLTVIEMTNVWASDIDLAVENCAKEDCSDTPQG